MAERGRKSSASLSVISGGIDRRPDAPSDLSADEVVVWERTVANEAADVFTTAAVQQLLKDYCRHVVAAERLSVVIDEAMSEPKEPKEEQQPTSLRDLDRLLKMRDRETKAIADKATKLRLTNQSRYTPDRAATAAKKATENKPWQVVS